MKFICVPEVVYWLLINAWAACSIWKLYVDQGVFSYWTTNKREQHAKQIIRLFSRSGQMNKSRKACSITIDMPGSSWLVEQINLKACLPNLIERKWRKCWTQPTAERKLEELTRSTDLKRTERSTMRSTDLKITNLKALSLQLKKRTARSTWFESQNLKAFSLELISDWVELSVTKCWARLSEFDRWIELSITKIWKLGRADFDCERTEIQCWMELSSTAESNLSITKSESRADFDQSNWASQSAELNRAEFHLLNSNREHHKIWKR
jgi:hypothetical protein